MPVAIIKAKPRQVIYNREAERANFRKELHAQAADMHLQIECDFDGDFGATVAFIGEGPGEVEIRKRSPFVGPSGDTLWKGSSRVGFTRDNIYVTNVVKRQLAIEGREIPVDEFLQWQDLLLWELSRLENVRTVFLLGNMAVRAVLGKEYDGITKWRGSVIPLQLPNKRKGHAVCSFNPAYVLPHREPRFEPFFMQDCERVSRVDRGEFRPHVVDTIINPSKREALAFIRDLKRSRLPIALDDEAINKELACIGLANDSHKAICINFRDLYKNRFSVSDECDLLCAIQDLCDSHDMIGQNAQFDSYFTWMHAKVRIDFWADTLLAHHTLYPTLPHGLGFLTTQYTNHPFYKDDGDEWREGGDIDTFWRYNGKDCCMTFASWQVMAQELKKRNLWDFFFNHVMRAQPHLVRATVHGIKVDLEAKERITKEVMADVDKLNSEFLELVHEATGEDEYNPNFRSWPQLQTLFFNKLGLVGEPLRNGKMNKSTNEDNRMYMMKHKDTTVIGKEILAKLNTLKEEDKFAGTYAKSKVSPDGRFRCEYKQFGVSRAPGRLSSSGLLVEKEGGNMQNQPVRARAMYIADPGLVLGYFDLAQAEAQVVSFRADIPVWKDQFARAKKDGSFDCHRALASEMFKVPYDQIPKEDWDENGKPTIRYVSKRCRHGLNYRMDVPRLSKVTGLSYYVANRAFFLYHKTTPQLRKWWIEEERRFRQTRAIFNGLGREFKVYQAINDDVLESIIAFYPQSTIGDKVVETWYKSEEDDEWPDPMYARVGIDVHDNLVCLSTPSKIKTCLKILKKHAESPIYIQDIYHKRPPEPLSIPAEVKMSYPTIWNAEKEKYVEDPKGLHRWSELKKVQL